MATYSSETFKAKTGKILVLRHCSPNDVEAFLKFQPIVASETTNTLQVVGKIPEPEKILEAWVQSINDPVSLKVGAFSGDRMIGQISFYPDRQPPVPLQIRSIAK